MTKIGIILGSTRPNRRGEQVADWVHVMASQRREAEFELVDLRDFSLPHLDEPEPAVLGQYQNDHTKAWSEKVACFDGFVMVTPEYNHASPGVLKNAIDFLYNEWNNKAVGSVSYGGTGGTRAVEQLRLTCGAVMMADIAQQVALSIVTEFENFTVFSRASTTSPPSTRSSIRSSPGAGDSSHFGPGSSFEAWTKRVDVGLSRSAGRGAAPDDDVAPDHPAGARVPTPIPCEPGHPVQEGYEQAATSVKRRGARL